MYSNILEAPLAWVDTHCHLDAPEFAHDAMSVRQRARAEGVVHCVIPAVTVQNLDAVRTLAHETRDSYCLGIHPLYVPQAPSDAVEVLDDYLARFHTDPRLVAVGEIGLDYFVPSLCQSPLRERQEQFYRAQLKLARKYDLPVVLHVRRSADRLLKYLREIGQDGLPWRGIAHAFNGSLEQAKAFVDMGFKLGFGGAVTFERALQLRRLAQALPLHALVLETDAPDIPPHWLYRQQSERAQGIAQGRNEPGELPRIAKVLAELRGITVQELAQASTKNAAEALPRLAPLLV
jgi:TatD DNase family protein